ncbi:MAG: insulinase family protein [Myxococcales bacterium]|nr:insulinase family protein [Myxococcales bacterium]
MNRSPLNRLTAPGSLSVVGPLATCLLAIACGNAPPAETPTPTPSAPPPSATDEAPPALVNRTKLPEPAPAPEWGPPEVTELPLSNGAKLWYLKQGKTPLVSVQLVLPNGASSDPPGKEGLTQITTDMLDEGAGKFDALALSEELQRLATDYGGRAATDSVDLGMSLLASNFDASMKILADIVMHPKFGYKDFSRRKGQLISQAIADEKDTGTGRINVTRSVLFGKGYGSYSPTGDRVSLKRIGLNDVKQHHKALFAPQGATFIVVGGIEIEAVKKGLEEAFKDWQGEPTVKPRPLEAEPTSGGVHFVDYPGATQSALAIAVRAESNDTKVYFQSEVYNWVLGGAFTSRLNLNLREDKGYTYGARSTFVRWNQSGFLWLAAKVKSETTRASIDEMLKEVAAPCASRPLTQKERDEAVNGMLLGFPGQFESVSGTAMQLAEARWEGHGPDWFTTYFTNLDKVSLGGAEAVAKRYCDPKRFVVVVAGDLAKVEPTLKGLDREVVTYDALGNPKAK